jgi:hypothetical protein
MTALDGLPPRSARAVLRAVIETPQASRNKVKLDPTRLGPAVDELEAT